MLQEKRMADGVRWIFWGWLIIVVFLNVVPLGNELNQDLTTIRFIFRLDYVVHSLTFLVFAWIWILGKIKNVCWFDSYEVLKFGGIVFVSAMGIELLQIFIPYRTFNPMDMMANLFGAILTLLFIFISHRKHREHRKVIYNTKMLATESTEDTEKRFIATENNENTEKVI